VKCSGRLYITDMNSCFNAEKLRFAILHKDVKCIAKLQGGACFLYWHSSHQALMSVYVEKSIKLRHRQSHGGYRGAEYLSV